MTPTQRTRCPHCDDLLDELARTRDELGAASEQVAARTWERDHAQANYQKVLAELQALQLARYRRPESAQ